MEVQFKLDRETKNTYLFAEIDEDGKKAMDSNTHVIGSLYVQKAMFSSTPTELTVVLSGPQLKVLEPLEEKEPVAAKNGAKA